MQHDLTKAKLIELIPEIIEDHTVDCSMDESHGYVLTHKKCIGRPITLADVLRAILESYSGCLIIGMDGHFMYNDIGEPQNTDIYWNLTTDYDGQSDDVKVFIGQLLGV